MNMPPQFFVALVTVLVVAAAMLAEARLSGAHERWLRARGAVEPPDDVYRRMQWAYPASFAVMAVEGGLFGPAPGAATVAGCVLFLAAKALKFWAMRSLGRRWIFRVLVLPGAPLVVNGPYAFVRHPNYIAVVGELAGVALLVGARVMGPLAAALFGWLLWRRIQVEDAALRHPPCT